MDVNSVLKYLNTDEKKGLSKGEVEKRLKKYGLNEVGKKKKVSPFKIFISQFTSPLVILLIISSIFGYLIGEVRDATLIIIIVILNGIFGFIQEYKAEKAMEELSKLARPKVIVIRDGKEMIIDSIYLVPGDIVLLKEGDVVPADIRIIDSQGLQVDESILTGESIPIDKMDTVLKEDTPLYKRTNMLFMGSIVFRGSCKGVVVETGERTELGKIAKKIGEIEEKKTAMRIEIERLASFLTKITMVIIFITFLVNIILKATDIKTAILLGISLGVAAIPEGLPIVLTIAMAIGAQRMLKKKVLIRKLEAIQDLGAVDVICTDKTGTITEGRLEPKLFFDGERDVDLSNFKINENIKFLLKISALCNDLKEVGNEIYGDILEMSLFNFYKRNRDLLDIKVKSVKDIGSFVISKNPFDPKRKMMSVYLKEGILLVKGAPEKIIEKSNRILLNGKVLNLDNEKKKILLEKYREMAGKGYYVIGLAYGESNEENNLIFVGLLGFMDKVRDRVKEAIKLAKRAEIRIIMVTGDNKYTAVRIAREIGMEIEGVMTGEEIAKLSDEELREIVEKVNIFARVSPDDKYRILIALQKNGHIVGMTGDGVNDALALKRADVGIAMGIRGTEVAKQVADVIILDDNFATIIDGVKEGRTVINNVYKFVNYLLTCNVAEVLVVFFASLFRKLILTPIQILWINLVTDGPIATSLSLDPPPEDIMDRKPRKRLVDDVLKALIGLIGLKKTFMILLSYTISFLLFGPTVAISTAFTSIIFLEFVRIGVLRTMEGLPLFVNKYLNLALLLSIVLQVILLYSPLNQFFSVEPLPLFSWVTLVIITLVGYALGVYITKWVMRHFYK